jgi:hypothetical protein
VDASREIVQLGHALSGDEVRIEGSGDLTSLRALGPSVAGRDRVEALDLHDGGFDAGDEIGPHVDEEKGA